VSASDEHLAVTAGDLLEPAAFCLLISDRGSVIAGDAVDLTEASLRRASRR
jgi:hypothetical protein